MIRRRLVLGALLVALFGLGWWVGRGATRDLYSNLDVYVEVLHKVQQNYVDKVEPARLVDGSLKGMLRDLDPYSQYLDEKSWRNLQNVTHGRFGGIGVVVGVRANYPTVISPVEGTPAWEAGLRAGDAIVAIDGVSSAGLSVEEAADRLRGPEGTKVRVTYRREGEEESHTATLVRREIVTRSVPYAFEIADGVGYLRLANFSETSGVEVRRALERLRAAGAHGFVLDLRSNPGGLLDQAVDVAERFVPEKSLVVYTKGRAKGQDNRYYATEARPDVRSPLVVLVDPGSASAAEIVAGALQDLDRALIVGETTFGKGSVQSVYPLRGDRAALKLTTALYYTPSGRSIHRPHGQAADGDEDEEEDDDARDEESAPAASDTTPRPRFHTRGGRTVYGGGGITPDLVIHADTLTGALGRIETEGLTFRFANRWINRHPASDPARVQVPWSEFVRFLRDEKVSLSDVELARQRAGIERALRREVARRTLGDSAAVRVALEDDPVLARAVVVLGRARAPRDVFALAPESRPGRERVRSASAR